jgi:hypothetical protein
MSKFLLRAICVTFFAFSLIGTGRSSETAAGAGEIYGVIEVGSSGIKGVVVQTEAADPESPPVKVLKKYAPLNKNAYHLEAAATGVAAKAVEQMHEEMDKDFNLAMNHFFVVGSSGIPDGVRRNLAETVFEETRAKIEFISAEKEISYEFHGIVPPRRFNQVVLIDIGSGNTKGAYIEGSVKSSDLKTFDLPWGTKTWTNLINVTRADGDFGLAADVLGQEKLLPAIKQITQKNPELNSLRRVYLAGGITWAMCKLLHPYEQGSWVKLDVSDIDSFYERAKNDPNSLFSPDLDQPPKDLTGKELEDARKKAEEDIREVSDVFSKDQLAAGAQILKGLKDAMGFDKKDAIFFAGEKALYAWDLGYIIEKITPVTASR